MWFGKAELTNPVSLVSLAKNTREGNHPYSSSVHPSLHPCKSRVQLLYLKQRIQQSYVSKSLEAATIQGDLNV